MAGKDFGGKMTVASSAGYRLSLRGTISVMPSAQSNDSVTNQDGSVDRVMTPSAPAAELSVRDDGLDARLNGPRENLTIVEEQTGVTHLFTGAFWSGRPSLNRINGEIGGISIIADYYRRLG